MKISMVLFILIFSNLSLAQDETVKESPYKANSVFSEQDLNALNKGIADSFAEMVKSGQLPEYLQRQKEGFEQSNNITDDDFTDEFWQPPKAIFAVYPQYPAYLNKRGSEAIVTILILINEDGSVLDVKVGKSQNNEFNDEAIIAARKWKFEPLFFAGKPQMSSLGVPLRFRLLD